MTDASGPDDRRAPTTPRIEPPRPRTVISAIWLVPLVAIVIALGIAWQSYRDRGERITITFPNAAGIEIGQTTLRYREVVVGVVEDVGFTPDLARVNVFVRVNQSVAPFLDESAAFWVVQPEVTARGITGLGTILSGVYIEGAWDSEAGDARTAFVGAERPPIVPPGEEGTAIELRATESNRLSAGAPILYKGIEVGQLAQPRLTAGGTEVRIDAFIRAPYDRRLSTATRFWDASGIGVSLGGAGVELRLESLAAVLEGGVVFDTLLSGGEPIAAGALFDVFESPEAARTDAFAAPETRSVRVSALFPSAAAGLSTGAPVRYQGIRVGTVADITGFVRPDDPSREVQLLAVLSIQPARMGLDAFDSDLDAIDYVDLLVRDEGLRARLVSTSLLGGDLAVELAEEGAPGAAALEVGIADNPLIPSVESEIDSFADTAEGVLTRLNDLPIEELLASATDLLGNLNRVVDQDDARRLPAAALGVLEEGEALVAGAEGLVRDGRAILSSPQTAGTLADVAQTVDGLRAIVARAAAADLVETLSVALAAAAEAAGNVAAGTEALPGLAAQAEAALAGAEALLTDEATLALPGTALAAVEGARDALTAPEVEVILNQASAAVRDARDVVGAIAEAGLAPRIDAALAQVEAAASNVAAGTADLDALATSLASAVAAAEGLLSSEDAQALPGALRGTLSNADAALVAGRELLAAPEIATLLAQAAAAATDLRAVAGQVAGADLAPRVDAALAQVEAAAANVAAGTADLDALAAGLARAVASAEGLLASEDVQALPADLRATLATADATLAAGRDVLAAPEIDVILNQTAAAIRDARDVIGAVAEAGLAPRVDAALAQVEAAASNVAAGTADLPALAASVERAVTAAEGILASDDAQALPATARAALRSSAAALAEIEALVAAPELDAIVADAAATAANLRAVTTAVAEAELAARLDAALAEVEVIAANVARGTADLDALAVSVGDVVEGARAIIASADAQALPASARAFLDGGTAVITDPGIPRLISELTATTTQVRGIVDALAAEEAAQTLVAALEAAERAAASVAAGTDNLPQLSARTERVLAEAEALGGNLNRLTTKANALALDELVTSATQLLDTADAFLGSDEADDVPVVLAAALEEVRATLETVRTGGTLDTLNATLVSTSGAAGAIEAAAADLPELVARLSSLSQQAGALLATYGDGSRLNTEFVQTLRAATVAAEDVSALARTLERNPNSLIFGR